MDSDKSDPGKTVVPQEQRANVAQLLATAGTAFAGRTLKWLEGERGDEDLLEAMRSYSVVLNQAFSWLFGEALVGRMTADLQEEAERALKAAPTPRQQPPDQSPNRSPVQRPPVDWQDFGGFE